MPPRKGEIEPPRRFYTEAGVALGETGYELRLDGRVARTPLGRILAAPTRRLAELVATEWTAQRAFIEFYSMPATRLLHTAIDGVAESRSATTEAIVRYLASDLLCYLAEGPLKLVERQRTAWAPLLAWAEAKLGLVLVQTSGILHRTQPPASLERASEILSELDDFTLAGLAFGSALFGSTVLALALREGRIDGAAAHVASRIEEAFQEERWGVDAEAAARTALLLRDALMLESWFGALPST